MHFTRNFLFIIALAGIFGACNLNREIDIDLPEYTNQPVVECYLEPGKPYRLALTWSSYFFDAFNGDDLLNYLDKIQVKNAYVEIRHNGDTIVLSNTPVFDLDAFKAYNYTAEQIVPFADQLPFELYIRLEDGKEIHGNTTILKPVPIDSIVTEFNETDTLARTLCYITDPDRTVRHYFRRMLHFDSLDSLPEQDFVTDDQVIESGQFVFGSSFDNEIGDTVFNSIVTMSADYYSFLVSVQNSLSSNGNPFVQPGVIESNVSGSANPLGIFTGLSIVRQETIIQK